MACLGRSVAQVIRNGASATIDCTFSGYQKGAMRHAHDRLSRSHWLQRGDVLRPLFQSSRLLLGLNCLEPSQTQATHAHVDQDIFSFVVEGLGEFVVVDRPHQAGPGMAIWAPAEVLHAVTNGGDTRLVLLVGIAPAPGG
jgi:quercetin dioxygenase-like cupin family protein